MGSDISVFRRQVRIAHSSTGDNLDARMVRHLERLEAESPHAMQEWMRGALRQAFIAEQLAMEAQSQRQLGGSGLATAKGEA